MTLTRQQAASELLARRKARASLVEYARYIDVPGAPLEDQDETADEAKQPVETQLAAHHVLTLEAIQRCIEKRNGRLMLLMPPGSAKSTYGSVVAPSWIMGKIPNYRMIGVSYGSDMARKFGRRTRSIIKQKKYTALFSTALSPESSAADEWALLNGSEYMSGGILSGITGNRADCLLESAIVETDRGQKSIKDIVNGSISCNVLSYEEYTGKLVYRPVEAVARSEALNFYRVHTASGRMVECTGNHRFYTGRGYIEARLLSPGDLLLLAMRDGCEAQRLPNEKAPAARADGDLLRPSMPANRHQSKAWKDRPGMQGMRRSVASLRLRWKAKINHLLLRGMQVSFEGAPSQGQSFGCGGKAMQYLRPDFQAKDERNSRNVLFSQLRKHWPFSKDAREEQPRMAEWMLPYEAGGAFGAWVQRCETEDQRARRMEVRSLHLREEPTRSPHQHGCDGQSARQSSDALQAMSHEASWRGQGDTETDAVSMVERVCQPASVYDIQVAGTRCFFANGILVHNCVVVDDPFKGRQDADSEVIRARTIAEYEESVLTRLKPGGSVIIINTRWHEGDLSGHILPENYAGESGVIRGRDGEDWEVICLAAKCERADDPMGRAIGEYLWPEWFGADHWAKFERLPRTWSALFQQRPAPDTGDYFKAEWIRTVHRLPPIETMSIYGGSDYAVSPGKGDYTVHVVVGVDHEERMWLLDLWRAQTASDVWVDSFCDLVLKWKPIGWAEETGQIKSGVGPWLVKRMLQRHAYVAREQFSTSQGNKGVRAQSVRGRMALSGLFVHADAEFLSDFKSELMSFPVGVHDDQVDALALVGQLMDRMFAGTAPKQSQPQQEVGAVYAPPMTMRRR